jgi:hypothetical protein
MEAALEILFIGLVICFIAALIRPKLFRFAFKKLSNRLVEGLAFFVLAFLCLIAVGLVAPNTTTAAKPTPSPIPDSRLARYFALPEKQEVTGLNGNESANVLPSGLEIQNIGITDMRDCLFFATKSGTYYVTTPGEVDQGQQLLIPYTSFTDQNGTSYTVPDHAAYLTFGAVCNLAGQDHGGVFIFGPPKGEQNETWSQILGSEPTSN